MPINFRKALFLCELFVLMSMAFSQTFQCQDIFKGNLAVVPPIAGSLCADIIDYPVGIDTASCQSDKEAIISSLSTVNTLLSPTCKAAVNKAMCTMVYPKCQSETVVQLAPCASLCNDIDSLSTCSTTDQQILTLTGLKARLNCSAAPWSQTVATCNSGPIKTIVPTDVRQPRCASYTGSVCAGNIPGSNGLVYIPAGMTEESLENAMLAQQFLFAISPQSTQCDILQQAWACSKAFMPCEMASLGPMKVPVPRLPCKSFCESYKTKCEPFFAIDPGFRYAFQPDCDQSTFGRVLNCDGTVKVSGQPNYPVSKTTFLPNPLVESDCTTWSSVEEPSVIASAVTQVHAICPSPLVIPDENAPDYTMRLADGACGMRCPMHFLSDNEYRASDIVLHIGTVLSFICTTFFCISWFVFKTERRSPYYVYINFCFSIVYLSLIISAIRAAIIGAPNMATAMCKNNVEEFQFEGYCLAQGIIFIYAVLSAMSWWLVQAFDIFRTLVLQWKTPDGSISDVRLRIAYHVFAWVPPLVALIILLQSQQIGGYHGGAPWCILSRGRYNFGGQDDYSLGVFYVPMMIYTAVGCILMFSVIFRIICLSRVIENRSKSMWERYMCGTYFRIVAFFFTILFLWVYMFSFKMNTVQNMDSWMKASEDFFICLLFTQFTSNTTCPERVPEGPTFGSFMAMIVLVSFTGFFMFLVHATTLNMYTAWIHLFGRCIHRIAPSLVPSCCKKQNDASYHGSHHESQNSEMGSGQHSGNSSGRRKTIFKTPRSGHKKLTSIEMEKLGSRGTSNVSGTHNKGSFAQDVEQPSVVNPNDQRDMDMEEYAAATDCEEREQEGRSMDQTPIRKPRTPEDENVDQDGEHAGIEDHEIEIEPEAVYILSHPSESSSEVESREIKNSREDIEHSEIEPVVEEVELTESPVTQAIVEEAPIDAADVDVDVAVAAEDSSQTEEPQKQENEDLESSNVSEDVKTTTETETEKKDISDEVEVEVEGVPEVVPEPEMIVPESDTAVPELVPEPDTQIEAKAVSELVPEPEDDEAHNDATLSSDETSKRLDVPE